MESAAVVAQRAALLAAQGRDKEAVELFEEGMSRFPTDARLANSAGNLHARARRDDRAEQYFRTALRLDPFLGEAATNLAIVLLRNGKARSAAAILDPLEDELGKHALYWVLRADAAKAIGDYAAADNFLCTAESCEIASERTARTRARLSLERGAERAVEDCELALLAKPGDFDRMHDYVLALHASGRTSEALEFATSLVTNFPTWVAGHEVLADLRWATGDTARFADHFGVAAQTDASPPLFLEWAKALSGADRHADAAEVLGKGLRIFPADETLLLAQAVALGEAGEAEAADAIFVRHGENNTDWIVAKARNDLRLGRVEEAAGTLEEKVAWNARDIAAWALLDLCWRLSGDDRHSWLHGQAGLVRQMELPIDAETFASVREVLRGLHASSSMPLAQSVKKGTQTRGALFARLEPELKLLADALREVCETYRGGLPPADGRHPLLSRRDEPWMIVGSWSVRFEGRGKHAAHIHPLGILSSACYFVVPQEVEEPGGPGWLELGCPPEGIAPDLPALATIKPREGTCVLFPSTLFHGTRAIAAGDRMSVAFDVGDLPK